jgi:cell division protein FtsB
MEDPSMNLQALWAKLQSLGFVVFAGVVVFGVSLMFLPLLAQRRGLQQELQRLDRDIARQEAIEKQQQAEIDALQSDPAMVERTVRQKLNLARPNEVLFRFEPAPATMPPTAKR